MMYYLTIKSIISKTVYFICKKDISKTQNNTATAKVNKKLCGKRKKNIPREIRQAAIVGDKILHKVTNEIIKECIKDKKLVGFYTIHLTSNKVICNFKSYIACKYTSPAMRGDYVEASIYYMNLNYGEERVKEYLLKQWKENEKIIFDSMNPIWL